MLGPTLETPRLILRPPTAADFPAYADFMADESVARHLGGAQLRSVAWRGLAQIVGSWSLQGFSMFSIVEKQTGRWVGRGGPWQPEGWPGPEVGWGIVASAQRRGYAKEAATRALDWVFDELGWTEVVHCIEPGNLASIGTATSLGSRLRKSGVAAPAPFTVTWDLYGQTREDWHERARQQRTGG
jgi:RimJ/RimL family protein N-acetyltransferase